MASLPLRRTAVRLRVRTRRHLTVGLLALIGIVGAPSSPAAAGVPAPAPAASDVLGVVQPAVAGGVRHPLQLRVLGRAPDATPLLVGATATGYTPAQVRAHLGLTGTGAGQTIAVVTAYDAPNVAKDLAVFNAAFGLSPPPSFRKVNQTGGTKYPPVDAGWALEAALDVQWAHAVAPDAGILLVEATSSALNNLMAAVSWAAAQPGVTVVSGSFGITEYAKQKDHDLRCRLATAACVFASGDNGNPGTYPASGPWGLAVGGTTLSLDGVGAVLGETAWSGSGGGVSLYTPRPGWQGSLPSTLVRRATPDVSYAGDPATGFAVYSSTPYLRQSGWFQMGGTSAGAPQWAGILASANQLRRAAGKGVLSSVTASGATPLHTAMYSTVVRSALFDVSAGWNGTCGALCTAGPGYDTVSGLGSPRRALDLALRDAA